MINDLYNARILKFVGNIPRTERLTDPDATVTVVSRLCGSKVTADVKLEDGVVTDFAHDVKACALGQSSSSIMARNVVGSTADELRALHETMLKMLKEGGPAPTGRWADLEILTPVRDYKGRHASVMLAFDAVVKAIDQIEAERAGSAPDAIVRECGSLTRLNCRALPIRLNKAP